MARLRHGLRPTRPLVADLREGLLRVGKLPTSPTKWREGDRPPSEAKSGGWEGAGRGQDLSAV